MLSVAESSAIQVSVEKLTLRPKDPFSISHKTTIENTNFLVRLRYKELEGLGEAAPANYHSETPETCLAILEKWRISNILGDDPFAVARVEKRLDQSVAGNKSAKAAVLMAMHDLCGKIAGQPVYKLLGLAGLDAPMTSFTIGIDTLDIIQRKTKQALEAGYKILKIKLGTHYDRDLIMLVRQMAPNMPLRVDANGAWSVKHTIAMSEFLADHRVEFIEQPLPKQAQLDEFRLVRQHSAIPIFADESIVDSHDVARFAGAVDGVVLKLAKSGGLLETLRSIEVARAHDMKVMLGCMIESSIAITSAVHIASLCDYIDLDGALLLEHDPYMGAEYKDGYMVLPERPGLGVVARPC